MEKLNVCAFLSPHEHRCAAVFDSLNNRGKGLSQLDLVKSLIYYKAMQVALSCRSKPRQPSRFTIPTFLRCLLTGRRA